VVLEGFSDIAKQRNVGDRLAISVGKRIALRWRLERPLFS
jgi:hypothetical protein